MRRLLDTLNRHLDIRLGLSPRLLLLGAAALLLVTLTQPLWTNELVNVCSAPGAVLRSALPNGRGDRQGVANVHGQMARA